VFLHLKLQVHFTIAAAFLLSTADMAKERQKYYIYTKFHLKPSFSKACSGSAVLQQSYLTLYSTLRFYHWIQFG